jgi:hypothetical protein
MIMLTIRISSPISCCESLLLSLNSCACAVLGLERLIASYLDLINSGVREELRPDARSLLASYHLILIATSKLSPLHFYT